MRHPSRVWAEPEYERESLTRLRDEYVQHLKSRPNPASAATIRAYTQALDSLIEAFTRWGLPAELGSLTPANVERWIGERRERGLAEEGIAAYLAAVKAFSNKYLRRHLEATTCDLLEKVERISLKETAKVKPMLDDRERDSIFGSLDGDTFADVRDRAMVAAYLSTGCRFSELLNLDLADLDRLTGEFTVTAKGGRTLPKRLSPKALKMVREYLRVRPRTDSPRLWLTERGSPLTYWGAQTIRRRIKQRSGVQRFNWHLERHSFGQGALVKGAPRAEVQEMLGHQTDAMTRHYTRGIREAVAAKQMPQYSLI